MCWFADKLNEQISDGHVKVFKICAYNQLNHLCGYFYSTFEYKLNKEFKTEICMNTIFNRAEEGFHSYSSDMCKIEKGVKHFVIKLQDTTIVGVYHNENSAIVEGYIPKGGIYYVNEQGEIVSDSIVLTKIQ